MKVPKPFAQGVSVRQLLIGSYLIFGTLLAAFCINHIITTVISFSNENILQNHQQWILQSRQFDQSLHVFAEHLVQLPDGIVAALEDDQASIFRHVDEIKPQFEHLYHRFTSFYSEDSPQVALLNQARKTFDLFDPVKMSAQPIQSKNQFLLGIEQALETNRSFRKVLLAKTQPEEHLTHQHYLQRSSVQKLFDATQDNIRLLDTVFLTQMMKQDHLPTLSSLHQKVKTEQVFMNSLLALELAIMANRVELEGIADSNISLNHDAFFLRWQQAAKHFDQMNEVTQALLTPDSLSQTRSVTLSGDTRKIKQPEHWVSLKTALLSDLKALERLSLHGHDGLALHHGDDMFFELLFSITGFLLCLMLLYYFILMLKKFVLLPITQISDELKGVYELSENTASDNYETHSELELMCQAVQTLKKNALHLDNQAQMLKMAESLTGLGSWYIDCRTRQLSWSAGVYKIYGQSMEDFSPTLEKSLSFFHPYDQEQVASAISNALVHGEAFSYQAKLVRRDGEVRTVECMGTAEKDAQGRVMTVFGALQDITRQKLSELEAQRNNEELKALVDDQTANLLRAKNEAERANKMKSQFLANLSHELRTPMHAIINFSRIGIDRISRWNDEQHIQNLTRIRDSGTRLSNLLNDLLDLSKLESGNVTYAFRPCDLSVVCKSVFSEVSILSHDKNIELILDTLGENTVQLSCDRGKIYQVLYNLITNAIKFTHPDSTVTVTLEINEEKQICMRVTDQGVGIPENELQSVFDKFIQSGRTSAVGGGTGLGLAICKEIVEAHHGQIWAQNNAALPNMGQLGTSFFVVLPATQDSGDQVEKLSA